MSTINDDAVELGGRMMDGAPVRDDRPVRSGHDRLPWLRESLIDLRRSLGRVPIPAELAGFLHRYQVEPTEIDALIDGELPGDLRRQDRPVPAASPLDMSASPAPLGTLVPPASVSDEAASLPHS
jgi:hypothetical protein